MSSSENEKEVASVKNMEFFSDHLRWIRNDWGRKEPTDVPLYDFVKALDAHCAKLVAAAESKTDAMHEALRKYAFELEQALAARAETDYKPWYDAVTHECTVAGEMGWDENDARGSLNRLLQWTHDIAIDPKVSEDAAKLVAAAELRGAKEYMKRRRAYDEQSERVKETEAALAARAEPQGGVP